MPRTKEQNSIVQEQSKNRIVEAALRLFVEFGYERTSIRMIAGEAGISLGLMYNYFSGKEALLREIFIRGVADVQRSFILPDTQKNGSLSDIPAFIKNCLHIVRQHEEFWRLLYALRYQPAIQKLLDGEVRAFEGMVMANLEQLCTQHTTGNPRALAYLLFALIDGLCTHSVYHTGEYPVEDIMEQIRDYFVSPTF